MAELSRQLGISRSTVFEHLNELRSKDLITTCPGRARSSRLSTRAHALLEDRPDTPPPAVADSIPLVGQVAAGTPMEAVEERETLSWPGLFGQGQELMALRVKGDSMIEEDIRPGDYVVCRRTSVARDGELVVALIEGHEATLKRFYREPTRARLEPANANYQPIFAEDCRIEAVVVGLIRQM
jgi:repressor LexA